MTSLEAAANETTSSAKYIYINLVIVPPFLIALAVTLRIVLQ